MRRKGFGLNEYLGCLVIIVICVIIVTIPAIKVSGGMMPDYSDGVRSGELYKCSRKGLIWKSWECQLKLSDFGLRAGRETKWSNVFDFSTRDDELGNAMSGLVGKQVKVTYRQYMITPIQQSSDYTAVSIEPVTENKE